MIDNNTLHLDIVSAEGEVFSGEVHMVFATGILGELGIGPGHAALLTQLKPGQVRVVFSAKEGEEPKEEVFYVSGGMLEVQPNQAAVLADLAVRADHLDEAAAIDAQKRAEAQLKEHSAKLEVSAALARLAETTAQIQAIQRIRKATNKRR